MLEILKTYSFETRAPAILGSSIKDAKVVAILDFNTANKMFNITSRHANIYPHLPTGTPRNPEKYTYYLFETSNAEQECLADVWINMDSVKVVQADTTLITVYNTNSQDREKLRKLLLSTGYQQFSIEVS